MKKRLEEIRKQAAELLAEARLLERVEEDWTTWKGLLDDHGWFNNQLEDRAKVELREGTDDGHISVAVKLYYDEGSLGRYLECNFMADKGAFVFWEDGSPLDLETIEKESQRGEEE